jgi:hypothetical protein
MNTQRAEGRRFIILYFLSLLQNPLNLMGFVKEKRHGEESIVC